MQIERSPVQSDFAMHFSINFEFWESNVIGKNKKKCGTMSYTDNSSKCPLWKWKVVVSPFSHSDPTNPSMQEQLPSKQVPPFKQEKSVGQTKFDKYKQCLHHNQSNMKNIYVIENTIFYQQDVSFHLVL